MKILAEQFNCLWYMPGPVPLAESRAGENKNGLTGIWFPVQRTEMEDRKKINTQ
jgi:hypothetical protein